jgi:hypothetical protein
MSEQLNDIKDEIFFESLSIRTSSVGGENTIPSSSLDFATLQPKQSGAQDLIITNGDSSALVFGASDIIATDISPFIMTETCSNKSIARNRSCKLTFSVLNNPSHTETVLTKSLTIKGSVIQLTATLAADLTPPDAPVANLIVSPTLLDFGIMKDGDVKELSIAVTNKGITTQNIAAPVITNPKIAITSNTCSALSRNRSCSIKFSYTASSDESVSQETFTSIANNEIKHSVLVQAPVPEVRNINPSVASSNVSLTEPEIINGSLIFTNKGITSLPSPVVLSAQPETGVTVNSVSCSGGLSRNRSCSVSYSLNSALLAGGISQVQLKLQSGVLASNIHTINLNVTKLAAPCTLADVQSNGWNTENQSSISGMKVGSDVSQCVISSCNQYFSVNTSSKSCQADFCTVDNSTNFGVSLTNVATVSGTTPNCVVASCSNPSLYDIAIDQKSCVDKPLACTLADAQSNGWNITNAQTPTGIKVGSNITQCSVSVCNNNFALNSSTKSCDVISCNLANAQGNGVSSILNVATVSGNLPTCAVSSCDANYKPAGDNQSCVAKLCNELNASELSALGFDITNATISGTYPSCNLSCNSSLQQLAGDSKSCIDKIPTGSISFVQDYTKNLSGNLLNITQTNAQSIQFYSDASCSTPVNSPLSMPLSQTSLTLSSTDGTKNAYAKLINGTASSSCLNDSIILDQTVPSLTITSPANGARVAGNSLTVTGTCSEMNPTTVQVGVTINGVTQTVNCTSGTFSSLFNITTVPEGNTLISASATDLAANIGNSSITINRSSCTSGETLSGNTCIENTPIVTTFSILNKNTNGYIKDNFVQLSIAGANATQMKISSDASCVSGTYEPYSSSKNFTVPSLNSVSTQQVYIKLKNILLESSCYTIAGAITSSTSSTYIHDNIAPTATITSPTNGSSFSTASLTVSGTCTGGVSTGSLIFIKEVGFSENNVTCSTTSYSYSLSMSAESGSKTIEVRQKDLADNQVVVSVSVTKTGPPSVPTGFECQSTNNNYPFCRWDLMSGATSYKFYRSTTLAGTYTLSSSPSTNGANVLTDNSQGTTYYYKVSSVNTNGESAQTSAVGVTNISYQNPSSANQKNISKGYITSQSLNSVNFTWDNSMQGATQYRVGEYSSYPSYLSSVPYSFNIPTPISSATYSSTTSSATISLASSAPTWILIEGINVIGTNTSRKPAWIGLKKEVGSLLFTRNFITTPSVQTGETFFDTGTTKISASGLYISETSSGPSGYKRDFSNAGDSFSPIAEEYYTIRLTFNSPISANNGSYLQVLLGNQNNPANTIYYPFSQLIGKTTLDFHVQSRNTPMTLLDQIWITAAGSYNRTTERSSVYITKIEIFD